MSSLADGESTLRISYLGLIGKVSVMVNVYFLN